MSDVAAIRARIGLDTQDWKADTASATADVQRLTPELAKVKAVVAQMESAMRAAGGGTAEAKKELQQYRQVVSQVNAELKQAERSAKNYAAAQAAIHASMPPPPKAADDSARYDAHWKRLEEKARSERARSAVDSVRAVEAEVAKAPSLTRVNRPLAPLDTSKRTFNKSGSSSENGGAEDERGSGGTNVAQVAELGHSARAIIDSLVAGQSPIRAFLMEVPRLLQAAGGNALKIATADVAPYLGRIAGGGGIAAAVVAAAEFAVQLHKAHTESVQLNQEIDKMGRPGSSLGGATVESATSRLVTTSSAIPELQDKADSVIGNAFSSLDKVIFNPVDANVSRSIGNLINQVLPASMNANNLLVPDAHTSREDALAQAQAQQRVDVGLVEKAGARDNDLSQRSAGEGADTVASDRLEEEFKQKSDAINRMVAQPGFEGVGSAKLIANLKAEYDLRKKIAEVNHVNIQSGFTLAKQNAETAVGDAAGQVYDTPNHSKALDISRANFDAAGAKLARLGNAGLDTRDAQREFDDASVNHYQTVNSVAAAVKAAEAQTRAMQDQQTGQSALAKLESDRANSEAAILKSQQEGTTEVTAQLQAQGAITSQHDKAEAYREQNNPALRAARDRALTQDVKDAQNYDDQGHTHESLENAAGMNFKDIGNAHMPGPAHMSDHSFDVPDWMTKDFDMPSPGAPDHPADASAYTGPSASDIGSEVAMAMQMYVVT